MSLPGTEGGLVAALLATPTEAIVVADRVGTIRLWNPGAVRIFGFPESVAVGQSLDLIIPPPLRDRHWAGWSRFVASGHGSHDVAEVLAVPALTADGRKLSVEFTLTPLRGDGGDIQGVVAILRDVTARFEALRDLRKRVDRTGR